MEQHEGMHEDELRLRPLITLTPRCKPFHIPEESGHQSRGKALARTCQGREPGCIRTASAARPPCAEVITRPRHLPKGLNPRRAFLPERSARSAAASLPLNAVFHTR